MCLPIIDSQVTVASLGSLAIIYQLTLISLVERMLAITGHAPHFKQGSEWLGKDSEKLWSSKASLEVEVRAVTEAEALKIFRS